MYGLWYIKDFGFDNFSIRWRKNSINL